MRKSTSHVTPEGSAAQRPARPGAFNQAAKSLRRLGKRGSLSRRQIVLADGSRPQFSGRLITVNNRDKNRALGFPSNFVSTTHYTWWNFLPKNLFDQFRRLANSYFLVCAALTLLPLSPYEPYSSWAPLIFVLGVSAAREALEDYSRYKQDRTTNARRAQVVRCGKVVQVAWSEIVVGDIVKVDCDETLAADMVLLSSSDDTGLCYLQTANLDGETNLKVKSCLPATSSITTLQELSDLRGEVLAEHPSNELYKFQGTFIDGGESSPILPDNVVLRGCELRNTKHLFGLVIYTGNHTRIEMNASRTSTKRSAIEKHMNSEIFRVLGIQFVLCFVCALAFGVIKDAQQDDQWFRAHDSDIPGEACETWFTWLLLLNVMLPISLYVTLELVKVVQGMHIGWDVGMYYAPLDKGCEVRSVGLNEELGQVSHVFSDKTGTLTRNEMVFMRASVGERQFRHFEDGVVQTQLKDAVLGDDAEVADHVHMFLLNLALCHTALPEPVDDDDANGAVRYLSPSPDEEALVTAAAANGYSLLQRTATKLVLERVTRAKPDAPVQESYEIVRVLEFTSDRKRMSIVLRCPDGRLLLLCKGADTEIYKRLRADTPPAQKKATTSNLIEFASGGLRTLVLGYSFLDQAFFDDWDRKYIEASLNLDDRDAAVEKVNDVMERNLTLVGATAIEDRLQDGVPKALTTLRHAGIRVWVLTGDKQETAINIGHSSGLLVNGMHIFVLNGLSEDDLAERHADAEKELGREETPDEAKEREEREGKEYARECFENVFRQLGEPFPEDYAVKAVSGQTRRGTHGLGYALVLDSETLKWGLDDTRAPDLRPCLLRLSTVCRSILLCRCTPLQKAQVVKLVKTKGTGLRGMRAVTLAIGDGANDVGMIKEAHVGIGISGKEGMQAVQNSDYAFAQFEYLVRLLLLHGRWCYRRNALLVTYSFYKNLALVITQVWFGFQSQFAGQSLYDGLAGNIYNVFFTSGILVTAILDKDASEKVLLSCPELYRSGILNERFTTRVFWTWWLEGVWDSVLIFLLCVVALGGSVTHTDGRMDGLVGTGFTVYTAAVLAVNFRLGIANNYWTWINWAVVVGSVVIWYLFGMLYATTVAFYFTTSVYDVFFQLMGAPTFWLAPVLAAVACNIPIFGKMALQRQLRPSLKQTLKEMEKKGEALPEPSSRSNKHSRMPGLAKGASIIINIGKRNRERENTGYAIEYDRKKVIPRALRKVAKSARALSARLARIGSEQPEADVPATVPESRLEPEN